YEGRLILQRKGWSIAKEHLPLKGSTESDWSYFLRVNQWRLAHAIPDEVFISVAPRNYSVKPEAPKNLGRDDYKPQYICFKNPFLTSLFEKLISKVPNVLKMEEMLPRPEQIPRVGKDRHVTEFVIQWYDRSRGETL